MKKILTKLLTGLVSPSLFGCQKIPSKDEILQESTLSLEEKVVGKWKYTRCFASVDDMITRYLYAANLDWSDLSKKERAKISEEAAMYAYDEEVPEEEVYYVEFKDGLYYDPSAPEGVTYEIDEKKGTISLSFADGESVAFIGFEGDLLRIDYMSHHSLFEKVAE